MDLDVGDRVTILYPDFLRGKKGIIKNVNFPFYTVVYNLKRQSVRDEDFVESEIKLGWD